MPVRNGVRGWLLVVVAVLLAACAPDASTPAPQVAVPTAGEVAHDAPAGGGATADEPGETAPVSSPLPTVTPAVTTTPIPTPAEPTAAVPTPLPAAERDYELCVSIASDSNGYGHVSFLVPDPDKPSPPVAITYITPIAVPLQQHLDALGLGYLEVRDQSLSAGGLTIESANYLESGQYAQLKRDRCKFVVITPFYPDVAVDLATPDYYVDNLEWLVQGITAASPGSRLLVLNYYQTHRADFSVSNSGRGLREERLQAFNDALAAACQSPDSLGGVPQVECVDISGWFDELDPGHVLGETTLQEFEASLHRENGYTVLITDYFDRYPDGAIVGDGIHLSPEGRDRLAEGVAGVIFALTGEF